MMTTFSWRAVSFILAISWVLIGPLGCSESAEDRRSRKVDEQTRALMREIYAAIAVALPASVDLDEFRAPANRQGVGAALHSLAANAQRLEQHAERMGGARTYLAHSIARDAIDVDRAYASGQYARSSFLVQQIVENCIGCHTRLPVDEDSPIAAGFVDETLFATLAPEPRASLQMATRRFDDARATLEELITSDEDPALLLHPLTDYLVLNLRVKNDFERPVPILAAFAKREDAWPTLRRAADGWASALPELAAAAAAEPNLAGARRILDGGKMLSPIERDHMPLAHWVAASAVLERFIATGNATPEELGEAHFLLGLIEARIGRQYWVTPAPYLLETSIRLAPGGTFAEDAYSILETQLYSAWEGTEVEELPPDDAERLRELRELIDGA